MSGSEIRNMIIDAGIPLWKVADGFGITDSHFSRRLRHSFTDDETKRLIEIIEKLKQENSK